MHLAITMLIEVYVVLTYGSNTECSSFTFYTQNDIKVFQSTQHSNSVSLLLVVTMKPQFGGCPLKQFKSMEAK